MTKRACRTRVTRVAVRRFGPALTTKSVGREAEPSHPFTESAVLVYFAIARLPSDAVSVGSALATSAIRTGLARGGFVIKTVPGEFKLLTRYVRKTI